MLVAHHHTAVMSDRTAPLRTQIDAMCPTDEIRPKPSMSSAFDAEGLLQTMQQDVVIEGVEGCRQVEEHQSSGITTIDGL